MSGKQQMGSVIHMSVPVGHKVWRKAVTRTTLCQVEEAGHGNEFETEASRQESRSAGRQAEKLSLVQVSIDVSLTPCAFHELFDVLPNAVECLRSGEKKSVRC